MRADGASRRALLRSLRKASLGISALHFYTFNQLDTTEEWRRGMIKALKSRST